MYRLGTANVPLSGEEDGRTTRKNVPIIGCNPVPSHAGVSWGTGRRRKSVVHMMRLKGDTLTCGLDPNATLRVLVRVTDPESSIATTTSTTTTTTTTTTGVGGRGVTECGGGTMGGGGYRVMIVPRSHVTPNAPSPRMHDNVPRGGGEGRLPPRSPSYVFSSAKCRGGRRAECDGDAANNGIVVPPPPSSPVGTAIVERDQMMPSPFTIRVMERREGIEVYDDGDNRKSPSSPASLSSSTSSSSCFSEDGGRAALDDEAHYDHEPSCSSSAYMSAHSGSIIDVATSMSRSSTTTTTMSDMTDVHSWLTGSSVGTPPSDDVGDDRRSTWRQRLTCGLPFFAAYTGQGDTLLDVHEDDDDNADQDLITTGKCGIIHYEPSATCESSCDNESDDYSQSSSEL